MKILILGIGNILFADEGIGVHFCNYIKQKYRFSSSLNSIEFLDGGTLAEHLIPIIVKYDYLIVLDTLSASNASIGDVYFFDFENVPNGISWQGSAHEVEMLQTLSMMDLVGDRPTTKILGIIPKIISDTTFDLSKEVIDGSKVMEKTLIKHLKELGFEITKEDKNLDIQDTAKHSYRN